MPVLVAALGRLLLWVGGSLIGKILLGLGIGVVASKGVDVMMSHLQSYVSSLIGGIDPIYSQAFDAFGFNVALNMLTSAYVARFGTQTAYRFALAKAAS